MIKKNDIIFLIGVILLFLPFFISKEIYDYYFQFNKEHGLITAFVKFAILATIGDVIGLRIKTGSYFKNGYGILPRMIVWGILGVTIKIAFIVFASGTPVFLESIGLENAQLVMKGAFTPEKLLVAFCISVALNLIYAPVMMTLHTITDMHIISNRGTLKGFFTPIKFRKLFVSLNWDVQWNFVFKKTIPLFWIPAHTITFLLPSDLRILFAALLGIALGTILAIADLMGRNAEELNPEVGSLK
jgi:hypothetical protein